MAVTTAAPPDLVREELARLMDSESMRRAPTHARLLRYLVERQVAGDRAALRETSIALEVFRRDPATYDPRTDPIVRVTVGRLRERLDAHYAHYDAPPRLRIVLPKGSYAPDFVPLRGKAAEAKGIAVLGTRNLTGDEGRESDLAPFAERLTDRLARAGLPRVIARASVAQAQRTSHDPRELATRLGVPWIVDSTLARERDGGLRLSVRLLDGGADVRWVETGAANAGDLEPLLDRVLDLATLRLLETPAAGARAEPTASVAAPMPAAARVSVERSRLLLQQRSIPATDEAIALAESVTRDHPRSADAWAALAAALTSRTTFFDRDPAGFAARIDEAAGHALAIDPGHPIALRTRAIFAGKRDQDMDLARSLFERALESMPNHTSARLNFAEFLTLSGRYAESRTQLGLARYHDPMSASVHLACAVCATLERRYDDASDAWALCRAAGETSLWLLGGEAFTALAAGRLDDAAALARKYAQQMPDDPTALYCLTAVAAGQGDAARARELDLETGRRFPWFPASHRALPAALLHDRPATLRWLEIALDRRDLTLLAATMHRAFDWLDGDPDYEPLRGRAPIWAARERPDRPGAAHR